MSVEDQIVLWGFGIFAALMVFCGLVVLTNPFMVGVIAVSAFFFGVNVGLWTKP